MTIKIELPKPHSSGQQQLIDYPGNSVCFAGRRWGKTQCGVLKLLRGVTSDPGLYWWCGLSWRSASMKRAWRELKKYNRQVWQALGQNPGDYIRESTKELLFPNDAEIWLRTAENPDSLAGEGIKGCVLDEFSLMKKEVWSEFIEATLLDYSGWALFAGVPKGSNWASDLYNQAQSREGWKSFNFSSYDNPFLDKNRLDDIKDNTPEMLFRQEYLAEIVSDAGSVFRNVTACAIAEKQDKRTEGHDYIFGVDWGKSHDYTAIAVYDEDLNSVVHLDRMRKIDYSLQVKRLQSLNDKFAPKRIICELNSIGTPIFEQLRQLHLPVVGFTTSASSKPLLIENLSLLFEKETISIIPDPVLIGELQSYMMKRQPSGSFQYSAPSGQFDDTVIACALACKDASRPKSWWTGSWNGRLDGNTEYLSGDGKTYIGRRKGGIRITKTNQDGSIEQYSLKADERPKIKRKRRRRGRQLPPAIGGFEV